MGNLPGDEQEVHRRPTGWGEVAQHTETPSFSPGGKWDAWAGEVPVLTYGDLTGLRSASAGSAAVSNGGRDR